MPVQGTAPKRVMTAQTSPHGKPDPLLLLWSPALWTWEGKSSLAAEPDGMKALAMEIPHAPPQWPTLCFTTCPTVLLPAWEDREMPWSTPELPMPSSCSTHRTAVLEQQPGHLSTFMCHSLQCICPHPLVPFHSTEGRGFEELPNLQTGIWLQSFRGARTVPRCKLS